MRDHVCETCERRRIRCVGHLSGLSARPRLISLTQHENTRPRPREPGPGWRVPGVVSVFVTTVPFLRGGDATPRAIDRFVRSFLYPSIYLSCPL